MKKIFPLLLLFVCCITTSCSNDNDDKEPTIGGISAACDQALVGTWKRTGSSWSYRDNCYLYDYHTYTFNPDGTGHYKILATMGIKEDDYVYEHDFRWRTSKNELTIFKDSSDSGSTYKYSISENGQVLTIGVSDLYNRQ